MTTARNLPEKNLPNASLIFDLITTNKLELIRSLLNPIPLHHRQLVISQKIKEKSLLYSACELNRKDIVKYFLDECQANIDECYWKGNEPVSLLKLAVQNHNPSMVIVLMRRFLSSDERLQALDNFIQTLSLEYQTFSAILRLYTYKKIHPDTRLVNVVYLFYSLPVDIEFLKFKSQQFLEFAMKGDLVNLQQLLLYGINIYHRNSNGDDALCQAIMHDQKHVVDYLVSFVYPVSSTILALEICGAKLIVFRELHQRGLDCWRKSVRIRRDCGVGFKDKTLIKGETDLEAEFKTEEEIDLLETKNDGRIYLQALVVFLRLFNKNDLLVQKAFLLVAKNRHAFNLEQSLLVLSELSTFPTPSVKGIKSSIFRALNRITNIYRVHFLTNLNSKYGFMSGIRKIVEFLNSTVWQCHLKKSNRFFRLAYDELLNMVLIRINLMNRFVFNSEEKKWIKSSVSKLLDRHSSPYTKTLLQMAIENEYPIRVISFLLQCYADPNYADEQGNTPLHFVVAIERNDSYMYDLLFLLHKFGAHLDSVNKLGFRPFELMQCRGITLNPVRFLSLQCLAARVIYENGISVAKDVFPEPLTTFMEIHSP